MSRIGMLKISYLFSCVDWLIAVLGLALCGQLKEKFYHIYNGFNIVIDYGEWKKKRIMVSLVKDSS